MRFFHNFYISKPIKLRFGTGTQNWMLIHITGSKSGFRDNYFMPISIIFGLKPLRNSVVMATPKIPGNQKLFERVCYILKLKVTKFQLPGPHDF